MNKVFKVIWSEARNAYVVVSEIAKNHGSKSCSTKKLLAMLIATGVMTCASVAPVMAANPAPNDTQIAVGKDAKANGGDSVAIGNGAEAKAANGIAIGYKSLSGDRGWGVAIGGNTQAIGTHSVALGQTAKALEYEGIAIGHTSLSEGSGAIAIGRSTNAKGAASLAFGNDAKALNEASIAFGQGSNSSGNGSIAVGGSSEANGDNSIAIGNQAITSKANSVVIGGHTYKGTTGTGVTGVGQQTQVSGNYSAAFGMAASANVDRATAIGSYANAMAAGSVALGAGSTVNRKAGVQGYDPLTGDTSANTHSVWRSTKGAVSVGGVGVTRQIINVAAGSEDADAVNVAQLKRVNEEALKHTTLSDGKNTTVVPTVKDGQTDYKVNVAGDLTDISSVANGDAKLALNGAAGTAGIVNGKGASVYMQDGYTVINSKVSFDQDGKISGVAAGINDNDAVNVGQLKAVGATANMGWNLATNGVATEATNVKPGDVVDFSGDKNISVSHDGTKVKVELNKNIDVNYVQTNALNAKYNLSVGTVNENGIMPFFVNSNGAFYGANNNFSVDKDGKVTATEGEIGNVVLKNGVLYKNTALRDGELYVGDADGNYSQITPKSAKLGQVTIDEKGNIAGVAAGAVTADSTDAVNGSQLHAVATEAGKHSKVVNGSNINVEETDLDGQKVYKVNLNKDIMLGDLTGKNVSISGTNGTIEATGAITTKDRVYADNGAKLADIDVTGDTISNGDAKLALNGAAGTAGMINGKGASVYMQDGYTVINSKVAFDQNGKISGVAAGAVTADSTDAVNGSQLHAVATEAGKHSKVVSGNNINVEETDVDGQKFYKVNMNKDIMLGDLTGKNVSISGTNGTIEATGAIATKDRVYADNGAKLADIDVTGNKISNGASSIVLDGSNVKVNDKVTIDQDGKISGVAAGEISSTSTDAINGSQLKETNDRVAANETAIKNNTEAISKLDGRVTANETAIKNNADAIGNLNTRVDGVEKLAKQHTTVAAAGDNITVTEDPNKDGGKEYKVALDKDINLDSVTTGQTVMNNDGLKVGKDVSVTATAVTAGQTSISNDGLKVNGKTYVSDSGLNANDQKITKVADGDISETSKDAVNGSQLYKTNQEVANNATNISSLSHSISNLDNRVNKVGAGAAALAALHPLDFDPDAKWDFAAGYGNYRGANAAAVGAYYRPNEDTMFSVGGTFGNGENMVNAGVSFKLGSGSNHVSTSRVAMAKEIKELRGELEAMKSAMLDANAGKKIDTSKLQLFPDVPQNHWAYEYVAQLAGNGMIEGYPDGNFAGDRPMTRYEFAAILYRAMTKGAVLSDKILSEFSHELEYFTVDTIAKDKAGNPTIQRVRTVKENKNK